MSLYLTNEETLRLLEDVAECTDFQFGSYSNKDMIFALGLIQGKLDMVCDLIKDRFSKKKKEQDDDYWED